jgi:hypothetical protein
VRWTTAARVAHRHARGGVVAASAETRGVVRASRGARARGGARDASAEATPSPREGARDGDGGGGGGGDGGDDDDGGDESDDDGDESDDGRRAVWVFSLVALAAPTFSGDAALSNRDDDRDDDAIARPTNDEKTVSVIVPALNEAATIETILTRVASLEPKAHEVIVCVGDSEDDTERIVHTKFPEFLVVRSKRGRSTQMNAGADVAGGDVFFFLHADTFVPSDVVDDNSRDAQTRSTDRRRRVRVVDRNFRKDVLGHEPAQRFKDVLRAVVTKTGFFLSRFKVSVRRPSHVRRRGVFPIRRRLRRVVAHHGRRRPVRPDARERLDARVQLRRGRNGRIKNGRHEVCAADVPREVGSDGRREKKTVPQDFRLRKSGWK